MESMNMADNQSRGSIGINDEGIKAEGTNLTVKINVDIADALTGLKAIQREAKEATKALRELENAQEFKQTYDSYRSFKHTAKYLTIKLRDGESVSVDLGVPTGDGRQVYIKGHSGIQHMYLSDEI
jgi:DNA polymerase III sliding clamp (beta) subunit (PCNA family)